MNVWKFELGLFSPSSYDFKLSQVTKKIICIWTYICEILICDILMATSIDIV